jgi:methionyl-tRNA formyltransferase
MTRVLLAGTRSFGIACAQRLLEDRGVTLVGVVAPHGDSLAAWAAHKGLHFGEAVREALVVEADVDLIVGAHCHDYISAKSRAAARWGALIGHPSLLPRHRGRDAVEWSIRMRDATTGFSWFMADSGIDTGPVVASEWCHIVPGWDASDLWRERLFSMGVELLLGAIWVVGLG